MKKEYLRPEVNEMNVITENDVMAASRSDCTHDKGQCGTDAGNICGCDLIHGHQGCGGCESCKNEQHN